jgi:hypothetical protein
VSVVCVTKLRRHDIQDFASAKLACPILGTAGVDPGWAINVGANGATDVVKLSTLLRAAGLRDGLQERMHVHGGRECTRRQGGLVLLLRIHYDNTWSRKWLIFPDTDQFRYRYSVINVPDEGFEVSFLPAAAALCVYVWACFRASL